MAEPHRYLSCVSWVAAFCVAGAGGAAPPARDFAFTVFSCEPLRQIAYAPAPASKLCSLEFYPTARSPVYRYRGGADFELVDNVSGARLARTFVPAEWKRILFLVLPSRSARRDDTLKIEALRDDWAEGLRVVNLSGLALTGFVNEQAKSFLDGDDQSLDCSGRTRIELHASFNGRRYPAYSEAVALPGSARAFLLLLPPYRAGSLEVQSRLLLDTPVD